MLFQFLLEFFIFFLELNVAIFLSQSQCKPNFFLIFISSRRKHLSVGVKFYHLKNTKTCLMLQQKRAVVVHQRWVRTCFNPGSEFSGISFKFFEILFQVLKEIFFACCKRNGICVNKKHRSIVQRHWDCEKIKQKIGFIRLGKGRSSSWEAIAEESREDRQRTSC